MKHLYSYEEYISESLYTNSEIGDIVDNDVIYRFCRKIHRNDEDFYDGDLGKRIDKFNHYKLSMIPINEINIYEWQINDDDVDDYAKMYIQKNDYPPIILGRKKYGKYTIIDGTHRANALHNLGLTKIKCWVGHKVKNDIIKEQKVFSYHDVTEKQEEGDPYFDGIFSNETSEFVEETIDILKLRELNGFSNDRDEELEQTVSYFKELDFDEDYHVSKELMDKIVDGIELNNIVVDENYKILDGRHRLAAYSELYFYYGYDFSFDGDLKIYKRIKN